MRATALTVVHFSLALGILGTARAEPLREGVESSPGRSEVPRARGAPRLRLVLRLDGPIPLEEEDALEGLLEAHLGPGGIRISVERSAVSPRAWLDQRRREPSVLLLAILSVNPGTPWQLSIVDAARGRAVMRSIDGASANAASLEAVASVLASAASALREGLEVASQPLDAVVESGASKSAPQPPPRRARGSRPAEVNSAGSKRPNSPSLRLEGGLGFAAATFAEDAPITSGVNGSFGTAFGVPVSVRLSVAGYLPVEFSTPLGTFQVARYSAALMLGGRRPLGALELQPELGVAVELLQRSTARPAPGIVAREGSSHTRLGPQAGARVRVPVLPFAALELTLWASYFPQRIRFMALSSEAREIGAPWLFSAGLQAGLALHSP